MKVFGKFLEKYTVPSENFKNIMNNLPNKTHALQEKVLQNYLDSNG